MSYASGPTCRQTERQTDPNALPCGSEGNKEEMDEYRIRQQFKMSNAEYLALNSR